MMAFENSWRCLFLGRIDWLFGLLKYHLIRSNSRSRKQRIPTWKNSSYFASNSCYLVFKPHILLRVFFLNEMNLFSLYCETWKIRSAYFAVALPFLLVIAANQSSKTWNRVVVVYGSRRSLKFSAQLALWRLLLSRWGHWVSGLNPKI